MFKILVAEDDSLSQRFVAAIIEHMGHAPFVSPNGYHAWDALKAENCFDLLITDLMMPGMDGTTLIYKIRQDKRLSKMPIIIMSAYVGMDSISSMLNIGATWFVPKPVDRAMLEDYVSRALSPSATMIYCKWEESNEIAS